MPYRVGQSTGHLLGLIAFLLPAMLLALERRRFVLAALALAALPLSGQLHLALGAIPLALGYAWARLPRADWWKAGAGAAGAIAAGLLVQRWAVAGSIGTGRSFDQVDRYSAELSDFVTRGVGSGVEELVFVGWLTPLVALVGLVATRRRRGLATVLGLSVLLPCLLALGANLPRYETLWHRLPGLDATRVPERFMPIACLALAALVALGIDHLATLGVNHRVPTALVACVAVVVLAVDLRVAVFGAVSADRPARRMPRSGGTGGCSSCRSSAPTSISGARTSRTRARAPGSVRRATPRSPRPAPSGSRASSGVSRAATASSHRRSGSAS